MNGWTPLPPSRSRAAFTAVKEKRFRGYLLPFVFVLLSFAWMQLANADMSPRLRGERHTNKQRVKLKAMQRKLEESPPPSASPTTSAFPSMVPSAEPTKKKKKVKNLGGGGGNGGDGENGGDGGGGGGPVDEEKKKKKEEKQDEKKLEKLDVPKECNLDRAVQTYEELQKTTDAATKCQEGAEGAVSAIGKAISFLEKILKIPDKAKEIRKQAGGLKEILTKVGPFLIRVPRFKFVVKGFERSADLMEKFANKIVPHEGKIKLAIDQLKTAKLVFDTTAKFSQVSKSKLVDAKGITGLAVNCATEFDCEFDVSINNALAEFPDFLKKYAQKMFQTCGKTLDPREWEKILGFSDIDLDFPNIDLVQFDFVSNALNRAKEWVEEADETILGKLKGELCCGGFLTKLANVVEGFVRFTNLGFCVFDGAFQNEVDANLATYMGRLKDVLDAVNKKVGKVDKLIGLLKDATDVKLPTYSREFPEMSITNPECSLVETVDFGGFSITLETSVTKVGGFDIDVVDGKTKVSDLVKNIRKTCKDANKEWEDYSLAEVDVTELCPAARPITLYEGVNCAGDIAGTIGVPGANRRVDFLPIDNPCIGAAQSLSVSGPMPNGLIIEVFDSGSTCNDDHTRVTLTREIGSETICVRSFITTGTFRGVTYSVAFTYKNGGLTDAAAIYVVSNYGEESGRYTCCLSSERECLDGRCVDDDDTCCNDGEKECGANSYRTCAPPNGSCCTGDLIECESDHSCVGSGDQCPNCSDGLSTCIDGACRDPGGCCPCGEDEICIEGSPGVCVFDHCANSAGPLCGANSQCKNGQDGFSCECVTGYELDPNGVSCSDIDECEVLFGPLCGPNEGCKNNPGGYECEKCPSGFESHGGQCEDVNECEVTDGPMCGANQICLNTPGSYECEGCTNCLSCPAGFDPDPSGVQCVDFNECENLPGPLCGAGQSCKNIPGSFVCSDVPSGPKQSASSVTDPHITTFDGYGYDCQGKGEYTVVLSLNTTLEVQARFKSIGIAGTASVTTGVAFEGEGIPRTQVSIPVDTSSSQASKVGSCPIDLFVNGTQRDLYSGSGQNDKVQIVVSTRETITISSSLGLEIVVYVRGGFGCFLSIVVNVPESFLQQNTVIGLFGSPNNNIQDDWMTRAGEALGPPSNDPMQSYNYCTSHWCLTDAAESLFSYELGTSFDDFKGCDVPYGFIDLALASDELRELCGPLNTACLLDGIVGGLGLARETLEDQRETDEIRATASRFRFVPSVIPIDAVTSIAITVDIFMATEEDPSMVEGFAVYRIDPMTGQQEGLPEVILQDVGSGRGSDGEAGDLVFSEEVLLLSETAGEAFGFRAIPILNGVESPNSGLVLNAPNGVRSYSAVFLPSDVWTKLGQDLDGTEQFSEFGTSVALSDGGTVVAGGAPLHGDDSRGRVAAYQYDGRYWFQRGQTLEGGRDDRFGNDIDLDPNGDTLIVGAPGRSINDPGYARVHSFNGALWDRAGSDMTGRVRGDRFGHAVALSENALTAAIGAVNGGANGGGYVGIFDFDTDWTPRHYLEGESAGDEFGHGIAMSGDASIIAVGAPSSGTNQNGTVTVYNRTAGWQEIGRFEGDQDGARFGEYVSLSRDGLRLAIGSVLWDGVITASRTDNSGVARVYDFDEENGWSLLGRSIVGNPRSLAGVVCLSADGNVLGVGALADHTSSGRMRVYRFNGIDWTQRGSDVIGENSFDSFGTDCKVSGDGKIIAAGAPRDYADGKGRIGSVRVYEGRPPMTDAGPGQVVTLPPATKVTPSSWKSQVPSLNGTVEYSEFGHSISVSQDGLLVAVGSPVMTADSFYGRVQVFRRTGDTWIQVGSNLDGVARSQDRFGYSVSLNSDGTYLAVGAPSERSAGPGYVCVYQNVGDVWTPVGDDIVGEANGDEFGLSVSISDDGSAVAMGAPLNNGNSFQSGNARVYDFVDGTWTQRGFDFELEGLTQSKFGVSVSLSGDSLFLAVGSFDEVKVVEWDGTYWTQVGQTLRRSEQFDVIPFGSEVLLSANGGRLAVKSSESLNSRQGILSVFGYNGIKWVQLGGDLRAATERGHGGICISRDGNVVGIGARDDYLFSHVGGVLQAYVFNGREWLEKGQRLTGHQLDDRFGSACGFSSTGDVVAVGAVEANAGVGTKAGQLIVFESSTTFDIMGSTDPYSGPTTPDECISLFAGDAQVFFDCLEDEGLYDAPFRFSSSDETDTAFEFNTEEASTGRGSIKGIVGPTEAGKVTVEYWSDTSDLRNMEVANLEYIQYDFFPLTCPPPSCEIERQFYLNVYTRTSRSSSTTFYDCRFDFVVAAPGPTGVWRTHRINQTSPTVLAESSGEGCGSSGTLLDATNAGYVLGTGDFGVPANGFGVIFVLNIGGTGSNNTGLVGYFDNIQIKLNDEDTPRVFNFEPGI